ncbi:MAG: hypothetical protein II453_10255 [Alphaproteobacteria bacterium]|nr:hypothetical protein [Alphaproteobacteria bacterium]
MDKEAKEVLAIFASVTFVFLVFFKLVTVTFPPHTQNIDIKNEFVELKKQRETLEEIKKQNEEIIKLLNNLSRKGYGFYERN